MKNKWFLIIGLVLFFQACIPSLHPLYTEDTIVFEESILGYWSDGPNQQWHFQKGTNNNYQLIFTDNKKETEYNVHLVKLGDTHFLDFYLAENLPEDYITPLIPSHTFAKVIWEEDKLEIYFFDYEWLEKLFKQRKIRLKHEVLEDGTIVLTTPTEELQKFVQKYAHEEEAFVEPNELLRAQ